MWLWSLALLLHAEPTIRAPTLRAELLELRDEDQRVRADARRGIHTRFAEVTRRHTARLRAIIHVHRWPGRSLVGEDGSIAAWVIAQHLDHDQALQQRCLTLLERAVAANEADATSLAFLTDRVLVNAGQLQRYGTQGAGAVGEVERARINSNRRTLGRPPLAVR